MNDFPKYLPDLGDFDMRHFKAPRAMPEFKPQKRLQGQHFVLGVILGVILILATFYVNGGLK